MADAKHDNNRVTTLLGVTDDSAATISRLLVDPVTGRLKVAATVSGSSVSSHVQVDSFTTTSGQNSFVLSQVPVAIMLVLINNGGTMPTADWTLAGSTITTVANNYPSGLPALVLYIY